MSTREDKISDYYSIVFKYGSKYKTIITPESGCGICPSEVWVFGEPMTKCDKEISMSCEPIIYRCGIRFRTVVTVSDGRGDSPDEVWVFGSPKTDYDIEIYQAHEPVITAMEKHSVRVKVHRIPAEYI